MSISLHKAVKTKVKIYLNFQMPQSKSSFCSSLLPEAPIFPFNFNLTILYCHVRSSLLLSEFCPLFLVVVIKRDDLNNLAYYSWKLEVYRWIFESILPKYSRKLNLWSFQWHFPKGGIDKISTLWVNRLKMCPQDTSTRSLGSLAFQS